MNLFKTASMVSLWTLLSRVTGLMRELLMASFLGASAVTDAFNVAFRIPNLLRRLFAEGAFSQAFVPILSYSKEKDGQQATQVLIDNMGTVLVWVLLMVSLLGVLFAPLWVWMMASGFKRSPVLWQQTVTLTQIMFPYILCMSLVAFSAGVLNTWKRFSIPAFTPVLLNLSMIAAITIAGNYFFDSPQASAYALAIGVMVGGFLQLGIQIPALYRLGLLPRIAWRWSLIVGAFQYPGVKRILRLMAPALLGVGVAQLSLLINTQIASHLMTGSVSWLTYADRLMEFPTALLGVALGVVLLPQLSAAQAHLDPSKFNHLLDWGLRWVILLATPCAVALLIFAEPLVSILYHYGAFTSRDVAQTAWALRGYGVGLLGLVAIKVLAPGFYARQDIRTPVKIAIGVLVLTQVMNIVWVPWIGHAGLALSISIGALCNASLLAWVLYRRGIYQPCRGWGRFLLKVVLASFLLGMVLFKVSFIFNTLHDEKAMRALLGLAVVLLASVFYMATLWLLKVDIRALMRGENNHK